MTLISIPAMRVWFIGTALSMTCGIAAPLMAQAGSGPIAVDLGAGLGYGLGAGERVDRGGFATDILVAWRAVTRAGVRGVLGIDASWQWQPGGDAICLIGRDGSCIPAYPTFKAMSVVAGGEWTGSEGSALRLLCGPGYYTGTDEHGQRATSVLGLQVRLDMAIPLTPHVAITPGARFNAIPRFHGQFYGPGAFIVGLRLQ